MKSNVKDNLLFLELVQLVPIWKNGLVLMLLVMALMARMVKNLMLDGLLIPLHELLQVVVFESKFNDANYRFPLTVPTVGEPSLFRMEPFILESP